MKTLSVFRAWNRNVGMHNQNEKKTGDKLIENVYLGGF